MEWYYERDRNGAHIQVLGLEKSELKNLGIALGKVAEKEYERLEKKRDKLQGMHEVYGISEKKQDELLEAQENMQRIGTFLSITKSK